MRRTLVLALGAMSLVLVEADRAFAAPTVRQASGANPAAIQSTVDTFRNDLGPQNPTSAESVGTGRRENNWDFTPEASAAPNNVANNFYNAVVPLGLFLFSPAPSAVMRVSGAPSDSLGGQPDNEFSTINPAYPAKFAPFSGSRLFTPVGTNVVDVFFQIPGKTAFATTTGFGAVFTDVDSAAWIQYFDANGSSLGTFNVPNTVVEGGLSFLGVSFSAPQRVSQARITLGNQTLSDSNTTEDLVVLDDFIYGEPGNAPVATAGAATSVGQTSATLNGTVNPQGGPTTTYRFEYGTTSAYGSATPVPDDGVGAGTAPVAVSRAVTGLTPNTTYHYRAVGTNAVGATASADQTFTTAPAPVVTPPVLDPFPVVSDFTVTASFRISPGGGSVAAVTGATVGYRLSEDATVTFTIDRRLPGRRRGRVCQAPSRTNRRLPACARFRALRGSFGHIGKAGANRFRFTGHFGGRRLAIGRYRLNARARDAGGQLSAFARREFRVVRR